MNNDAFITKNIGNVWKIPFTRNKDSLKKTCGGKKDWGHAGFPKELCDLVVELFSNEDQTILDCFMGLGQLALTCKKMNRNFIGIEKDNEIYEVAINRIESENKK